MIRFACPACNFHLNVTPQQAGIKLQCPNCDQRVQVPSVRKDKTVLATVLPETSNAPSPTPPLQPTPGAPFGSPTPQSDRTKVDWHYQKAGQQCGPVAFEQLQQLASAGNLTRSDLVIAQGMGQWLPAEKIGGLFSKAQDSLISRLLANFQSASPMQKGLVIGGGCLCLVLVIFGLTKLAGTSSGFAPDERFAGVKQPSGPGDEIEKLRRDVKTAEESAAAEKALAEKFKQEIKVLMDKAEAFISQNEKGKTSKKPLPELFRELSPSVPYVLTNKSSGSGFLISKENRLMVVTNRHVIAGATNGVEVHFFPDPDNREVFLKIPSSQARIVAIHRQADVAFIDVSFARVEIQRRGIKPVPLVSLGHQLHEGEFVFAIGHPGAGDNLPALKRTLSPGYISGVKVKLLGSPEELVHVTAAINPGNSGGPIFNDEGQVLGIATYFSGRDKSREKYIREALNFGVTISYVYQLLDNPTVSYSSSEIPMFLRSTLAAAASISKAQEFKNFFDDSTQRLANAEGGFRDSLVRGLAKEGRNPYVTLFMNYGQLISSFDELKKQAKDCPIEVEGGAKIRDAYLIFLDHFEKVMRKEFAETVQITVDASLTLPEKEKRVQQIFRMAENLMEVHGLNYQQVYRDFSAMHDIR
jgi:S1-C subfamily serine protease